MSLTSLEYLEAFKQLLSSWKACYRYADVAFISLKTGDAAVLLFGRIIFEPALPLQPKQSFQLNTEQLVAQREVILLPSGGIDAIIDEASRGQISLHGEQFLLKKDGERLSSFMFPLYHPSVTLGPRLPTLVIYGVSRHTLLTQPNFIPVEHLDWSLKASDQPFDSLDELLMFLGFPRLFQTGDPTSIEIVARSPIEISGDSHIENGEAYVKCRMADGLDIKKLKLGYKIIRQGSTDRSFISGDSLKWKREGLFIDGSAKIPVGEAIVLQAFVSYEGTALQQWWVTDPTRSLNVRRAAYEAYDKKFEVLRRFLAGEGNNKSDDFESGVALLLHLLGFIVAHMGLSKLLEEGPDILASTPSGNVAVIECTIGLLNERNKFAKLVRRTTAIRDQLSSAGHAHIQVQPIIVTALSRNAVQAELGEATKNAIAVVCKEELDTLLNETSLLPNPEELFKRAADLVPKPAQQSGQESLFSNK